MFSVFKLIISILFATVVIIDDVKFIITKEIINKIVVTNKL